MKYAIPKAVTVGKNTYTIQLEQHVSNGFDRGLVDVKHKVIKLGKRDPNGYSFSEEERYETLFHEMTHAILYEMRSPLWENERFVERFAKHLTNAIVSAKL
jgi:hypothetical protein